MQRLPNHCWIHHPENSFPRKGCLLSFLRQPISPWIVSLVNGCGLPLAKRLVNVLAHFQKSEARSHSTESELCWTCSSLASRSCSGKVLGLSRIALNQSCYSLLWGLHLDFGILHSSLGPRILYKLAVLILHQCSTCASCSLQAKLGGRGPTSLHPLPQGDSLWASIQMNRRSLDQNWA